MLKIPPGLIEFILIQSLQFIGLIIIRMWECFYLKVIPICERSILTEYYSKIFPIVLIDDWDDLNLESLRKNYDKYNKWDNYYQLDFQFISEEVIV